MSLKANTPLSDLFSLLESKYTLRLCWALKDGHPQNFRLLQDSMGVGFQFLRKGYFCADKDSTPTKLVFNRTVGLKDTWAKEVKKGA